MLRLTVAIHANPLLRNASLELAGKQKYIELPFLVAPEGNSTAPKFSIKNIAFTVEANKLRRMHRSKMSQACPLVLGMGSVFP